jgi:hypothetical protein
MPVRIWKHKVQGVDGLTARLLVLNIAAVIALYVLVSMVAALARFPGQETDGKSGRPNYAVVIVPGPEEARQPWVQDFIPWRYRDRVTTSQTSVASGNPITTISSIGTKVAQVTVPGQHGIIGCTLLTPLPRLKRPAEKFTQF